MRTIYLYVEMNGLLRKVAVDMAFLGSNKKIRLLKHLFEDGLYFLYKKDVKNNSTIEKYHLTKDKIMSEDNDHYFFKFPFKLEQVLDVAV